MVARLLATGVALLFAIGAFFGLGEGSAGLFNPFGFLFLLIAFLVWRYWGIIVGTFSPGLFDGMTGGHGDHYRGSDDHYRRDGQRFYREPEGNSRRDRQP